MAAWWEPVYCVSTPADGNINLSSAPSTIDGVAPPNGKRVLLTQQTTASQNTTYIYNTGTPPTLTATTDVPVGGAVVRATNGNTLAHTEHSLSDTTNYQWTRQFTKVNVKDFGALGDGSNDYTAITTAMNSLPASGGTLLFPAGKAASSPTPYSTTTGFTIPANVRVEFEEGAILAPSAATVTM